MALAEWSDGKGTCTGKLVLRTAQAQQMNSLHSEQSTRLEMPECHGRHKDTQERLEKRD